MTRQTDSGFGRAITTGKAFAALLSISTSGIALAQAAPASGGGSERVQLEEIIVTANKREETLLRAPVAVSALPMATLRSAGVVGIQGLNSIAPNTQVRTIGADNGLQFSIRGVSNMDFNDTANPAVGTYIDGVYVGRTQGLAGALYDLERIEVLRGPQGTLYGRNSTGGNVNILTADPKHDFDASADLSYGNYNDIQAHAMLNLPVSETLAVRAAVTYHRNDGYFDTRGATLDNYGKADEYAGRLTFLWTPTGTFRWRFSIDDYVSHGTPSLDQTTAPNGKPLGGGSPYSRPISGIQEPALYVNNLMLRSRMELDLSDSLRVTYIAGYQHVKDKPQTVLVDSPFFRNTPSKTHNQEVELSFDRGPIHNIVGASYLHQKFFSRGIADFINTGADTVFIAHGDAITEAWGIFDQLTFDVTDRLKLTGGIRYSSETFTEKDNRFTFCALTQYPPATFPVRTLLPQHFTLPGCLTVPGLAAGATDGRVKSSSWNYRAGLEYDVSDGTSTYLTVTSGFKAGGLNLGPTVAVADFTFRPEKVTNYEFGLKTRLFDNSVGLNAALFYTDYSDIQVTQLSQTGFANVTRNAAGARMYGVELEGQWQLGRHDRISGFFNHLNAEYSDYVNAIDEQFGTVYPSLKGNYQPYAAKFSGRVQYAHEIPLANGGKLTGTAAVYWQTHSYLRAFNLPIDRVPAYSKTDLELRYADPTGHFTVSGFVHNLEDKAVRNGGYAFVGSYLSSYNPPRTYGLRIGYEY